MAGGAVLVDCASDPRESQAVQVISNCDLTKLDTSTPDSPGSTVKAYVQATTSLAQAVATAATQLQQVCNNINAALNQNPGSDPVTACQPIAKRATACILATPAGPPGLPPWFNFSAPQSCQLDPSAETKCIATCYSGACDVSKCTGGTVQGTCPGTCTGTCATNAKSGTCNGSCEGTCANENNACTGECIGQCADFALTGGCDQGCPVGPPDPVLGPFFGYCAGTCTGSCTTNGNTVSVNGGFPVPPDAGSGDDSGTVDSGDDSSASEAGSGEGGPADAGPTDSGGGQVVDAYDPNDCPFPGFCTGTCDTASSGECFGGCTGNFNAGVCNSTCAGNCVAGLGSGCTVTAALNADGGGPAVTCDGTCIESTGDGGTSCSGTCQGTCSTAMQNGACSGSLSCGQNTECGLACHGQAGTTVTCTAPDTVEVEAVTDPALYAALKKYGPQLATALQTIQLLKSAEGAVYQRTIADFQAVGATGDLVQACVVQGQGAANQAHSTLQTLGAADPTIVTVNPTP